MAGTAFCELRSLTSVVTGKNQGCIFFQYCLLAVSFPLLFPSRLSFTAAKRTERLRIRFRIPARQSTSRRCLMGSGSQRSTGRAGGRRSTCCYGTWGHGWTSGSARTLLVLQEGRDTQHRRGFSGSLVRRSIQQGAGHCFFSDGTRGQDDEGSERAVSLFAFFVWPGDMDLQKTTKNLGWGAADTGTVFFDFGCIFSSVPLSSPPCQCFLSLLWDGQHTGPSRNGQGRRARASEAGAGIGCLGAAGRGVLSLSFTRGQQVPRPGMRIISGSVLL